MSKNKLIVQKYGGATLSNPEKIKQVAKNISGLHKAGVSVVVVVSAMGQTTNELIQLANKISERPSLRELDMLLSVGERISMSLLSMALNDLGYAAISFTGSQAGIITNDSHINASILDVKAFRVEQALKENKIVILAGFQGVSQKTKEITTLGRGGSDITAVAIADYLKADKCEILKDVDGVFTADPKIVSNAKIISELSYDQFADMTSWGAKVLNYSSVEMAAQKNVNLFIGSSISQNSKGTLISSITKNTESKMLAVNSFSKIINLKLNDSVDLFSDFLQKNQIAHLRNLYSDKNSFYFTGPDEALSHLINFEGQQSFYKIINPNISSVSITYSESTEKTDISHFIELLKNMNISTLAAFKTNLGIHFFVSSEKKNETLQFFHSMI